MQVHVCGVRGSTPSPGDAFARVGGHTSCIAIGHDPDERPSLVLDAGTGLRYLSKVLAGEAFVGTMILGHLHWDHMMGLPFFAAGDRPDSRVRLLVPEQGSSALELLDQVNGLDAFIAPVGGGGLMSGCAIALRARSPHTVLVGAEPAGADDAQRSLAAGHVVSVERPNSICDGLLATLGEINRVVLATHGVEVLIVDDAAVRVAMRRLWERLKLVVEPSSAITYAVLCAHRERFRGQRIGVLLSGGNVDLDARPF